MIQKLFVRRNFCVAQGTCPYNGTFPTRPLLLHLHPKPCHPLSWLMLCGSYQHHQRQRGHPSWGGCSVTVGFSSARLRSNPHAHTHTKNVVNAQIQPAVVTPLLASCATLSTVQNRSHSRAGASAGRHATAARAEDTTFFRASLKQEEAKGTRTIDWQV